MAIQVESLGGGRNISWVIFKRSFLYLFPFFGSLHQLNSPNFTKFNSILNEIAGGAAGEFILFSSREMRGFSTLPALITIPRVLPTLKVRSGQQSAARQI
jgi:hypothetical protein